MKSIDKDALETELVEMIIDVCNVTDAVPDDLSPDDPFIGPESCLGIDSLDAVEIVVALEKKYKIHIGSQETARQIFVSLRTLAKYIRKETGATRR